MSRRRRRTSGCARVCRARGNDVVTFGARARRAGHLDRRELLGFPTHRDDPVSLASPRDYDQTDIVPVAMSRGRVSSSTFAFCASLVVHAAILYALVTRYLHDVDHIYLAGFVRDDLSWTSIALEPVTPPPPPSHADDTALGEQTGHGDSINPAEGERLHEAPRAEQSQLFLS